MCILHRKYCVLFCIISFLFIATPTLANTVKKNTRAFNFAVIGDLPYKVKPGKKSQAFDNLVHSINTHKHLAWVLHIGDIKSGASRCSDTILQDRLQRFSHFTIPFLYTPGDNEWTDCHRVTAGNFDPLERLKKVRELFFHNDKQHRLRTELNIRTLADTNPEFSESIEDYTWQHQSVRFVTSHIVGSLNGRKKFSSFSKHKRTKQHDKEVKYREKASLYWLQHAFELAQKEQATAVVVAIHANPGLDSKADKKTRQAFTFFTKALAKHANDFQKPVLLIHGDSHYFRIDKPRVHRKYRAKNIIRMETFGDSNSSWVKVNVDPNSKEIFSFSVFD